MNRKLYGLPEAQAFAFLPPAIPGVGQAGGVDVFIQDRAGKTVDYLWQNTQRFMAELQKRPEIAFVATTYAPAVPQLFAHVDEDGCSSSASRSRTCTRRSRRFSAAPT